MDFKTVVASLMALEDADMRGMKVSLETCLNMVQVLAGSEEDFVLFSNTSTEAFSIWRGKEHTQLVMSSAMLETHLYAFRYEDVEHVAQMPISIQEHRIVWRTPNGDS